MVGAAPENLEDGIGLSATLAAAVGPAAARVLDLLAARPWALAAAVIRKD